MNFATLCSGIGAPEVAADRLGMEPVFCSEVEPFPCGAGPPLARCPELRRHDRVAQGVLELEGEA